MSIIRSNHNSSSPESIENRKFNENLVNELREKISNSSMGGRPEMVERHKDRGKFLARERIDELIDPETPFLEL